MLKEDYGLKGSPNIGLAGATLGFFVGFAAVALYGPTAKMLKDVMGLSGTLLGFLVAAPQLTGSLLRIPFGAWVDRVGGKKPMITLLIMSLIGMIGLTSILFLNYPQNLGIEYYPLILFFGFLSGCGVATFSVGIPQTSYWFPLKKQGIALGTYAGLGNTAPGIFTILLPFALAAFGLAGSYLAWTVFLFVGLFIYLYVSHDAFYFQLFHKGKSRDESISISKGMGQELIPSGQLVEALKKSAKIGRTWALVILYFTSFGGFLALTVWFPTYWIVFHGFDLKTAALLGGVGFSLLASFIRVYGGHLSDKIGGETAAIISFSLVTLGALVLMFAQAFGLALFGELLIGAGMGIANAAVFKLVAKYVPEAVGGASGWVGGLGAFGGFAVPPMLGLFVDIYGNIGYAKGFVIYVILGVLCIVTAIILMKKFGKAK
ncbi:putative nitrate transporter NarT [bacterium BMS3Abin03]|nr:putative nitrate transporter NarT [bacterium BMS3Abin03]